MTEEHGVYVCILVIDCLLSLSVFIAGFDGASVEADSVKKRPVALLLKLL